MAGRVTGSRTSGPGRIAGAQGRSSYGHRRRYVGVDTAHLKGLMRLPESVVREGYQVVIPESVRRAANLRVGETLKWDYDEKERVMFLTKKPKRELVEIKTEDFTVLLRVLRNPWEIGRRLRTTVPIAEDLAFIVHYYYLREHQRLDLPELAGVLRKLFGDPDDFYDTYKCSFNYTFDAKIIIEEDDSPARTVDLVLRICDYKGEPYLELRRPKESEKDNVIRSIDDVVKRKYLDSAIAAIDGYFYGFYQGYGERPYEEFEAVQPYLRLRYGYRNGRFFRTRLPSD